VVPPPEIAPAIATPVMATTAVARKAKVAPRVLSRENPDRRRCGRRRTGF
jgi:hypothetical protein